ncbi:hypothetical protein [Methylosarcina fibrata]|uniref:hypothetical protein n=1 Tax=Methylosarcina fibrata TaxID=105972 RepID=UPI0012F9FF4F|nr:hypothetical protein [Methylosarcina fibrata]
MIFGFRINAITGFFEIIVRFDCSIIFDTLNRSRSELWELFLEWNRQIGRMLPKALEKKSGDSNRKITGGLPTPPAGAFT